MRCCLPGNVNYGDDDCCVPRSVRNYANGNVPLANVFLRCGIWSECALNASVNVSAIWPLIWIWSLPLPLQVTTSGQSGVHLQSLVHHQHPLRPLAVLSDGNVNGNVCVDD